MNTSAGNAVGDEIRHLSGGGFEVEASIPLPERDAP